jgi:hypothetical protein
MRIRSMLVAAALAAAPLHAAHAAPFDGAEDVGSGCAAVFANATDTDRDTHTGVLYGGPWVAADVVENVGGVLGVDSRPGLATDMRVTCLIRRGGRIGTVLLSTTSSLPAGSGVVVMEPRLFAFVEEYTTFTVCTQVDWTDTRGVSGQHYGCGSPQEG